MTSTGKTVRSNATGTLTQYSITISNSPGRAATNTCLIITFRGGGLYAAPQFEPGPVASNFEFRFIGTELSLCQRYYIDLNNSGLRFPVIQSADTTNCIFIVPTGVPMRVAPTITGEVKKAGVNTGSSLGSGAATAGLVGTGPYVRVSGNGFSATTAPAFGRIEGGLDAEL
jgi:hypothetical protein